MRLRINGSPQELDLGEPPTVAALVERLSPRGVPCAVELNRRVVPVARRHDTVLHDDDAVEIVTLVGGG